MSFQIGCVQLDIEPQSVNKGKSGRANQASKHCCIRLLRVVLQC